MTTGLTYSSYQTQIAEMAVVSPTDPNFLAILPAMIDYAELRIYRDLDLLATVTTATQTIPTGTRSVTFPQFVTVQEINAITPYGTVLPDSGTRVPLLPTTKEFININYPSATYTATPSYFAPQSQSSTGTTPTTQTLNTFLIAPFPDGPYTLEIIGTYRPPSLSATVSTTFISQNLPSLFIMASMVYISAYQRNFGRQSDDPSMAVSYESQYQALVKGATVEEFRKKFEAGGWSSMSPAVVATPGR